VAEGVEDVGEEVAAVVREVVEVEDEAPRSTSVES
jgi:hypothetical protein